MSDGEIAYLTMAIGGAMLFALILAFYSSRRE
jgi:hypothetical protein